MFVRARDVNSMEVGAKKERHRDVQDRAIKNAMRGAWRMKKMDLSDPRISKAKGSAARRLTRMYVRARWLCVATGLIPTI